MNPKLKKFFLFSIILFNAGVFILYATMKLIGRQFAHVDLPDDLLLKDVHPTAIMWHFFSLNKGYGVCVALAQIIPSILILFKRTRLIGGIFYFFAAGNILILNIFFDITIVTLILSCILFLNTLIILYSEREKIGSLLK